MESGRAVVAVVALAVVTSGQRAQAQPSSAGPGGPGWVLSHQKISDTEADFTGTLDDEDRFSRSLASLGDPDSNGVGDLAVGTPPDDDGGFNRGAVWVLFLDGICLWDLDGNGNGAVGVSGLLSLLASLGPCPPKADCPADFDGNVGVSDLLTLLANWGPCP